MISYLLSGDCDTFATFFAVAAVLLVDVDLGLAEGVVGFLAVAALLVFAFDAFGLDALSVATLALATFLEAFSCVFAVLAFKAAIVARHSWSCSSSNSN